MIFDSLLQIAILVAVAALVVGLLTRLIRASYNIRITVRGGEVQIQGTVLAGRKATIAAFFSEWLPAVRDARLYGHWDGHRLSLYGSGISSGEIQRLRNYLLTEL